MSSKSPSQLLGGQSGLSPRMAWKSTPPTQMMNLRYGASASETWTGGNYWHFASYAYQPVPVTNARSGLRFYSYYDQMLAGDSEDWNNTYRTGRGHGALIHDSFPVPIERGEQVFGIGNILSCWSYNPFVNGGFGSSYYIVENT